MKNKILTFCLCVAIVIGINVSGFFQEAKASQNGTAVYISSLGNDLYDGLSTDKPVKNFRTAYSKVSSSGGYIILLTDVAYLDSSGKYSSNITIRGNTGNEILTLPTTVKLMGNLKIENVSLKGTSTIYANGHTFEIADSVSSIDNRLTVYGGGNGAACTNTDIRLCGGKYQRIYAGGNGGVVNGNTNIILGGNANLGDSIDDDSDSISPCYVYGGGRNAAVLGSTNITLDGNAVTKYIVGAGNGTKATAVNTNIDIKGGKVMNVYGGSVSGGPILTNCNTHINMTGGVAEALFGGSETSSLTGNTYITVSGGEITRRIYTGCYNNASSNILSLEWASTNYHVIGTTNLTIYPNVLLATGNGLSGTNCVNRGIFSGSRMQGALSDEKNTVIFLDGCYNTLKSKLGELGPLHKKDFKSFQNYTVNAGAGGVVEATNKSGEIVVIPESGKSAILDSTRFSSEGKATITLGSVTAITFDGITSVVINENEEDIDVVVKIDSGLEGDIVVALYNGEEKYLSSDLKPFEKGAKEYEFNLDNKPSSDYLIKVFVWDGVNSMSPHTKEYIVNIEK